MSIYKTYPEVQTPTNDAFKESVITFRKASCVYRLYAVHLGLLFSADSTHTRIRSVAKLRIAFVLLCFDTLNNEPNQDTGEKKYYDRANIYSETIHIQ